MNFETILGLTAGLLTTASFLPQLVKSIKTRSMDDLALTTYIALSLGVFLWVIYGLLIGSVPVIATNSVTLIFTLTILVTKIKS